MLCEEGNYSYMDVQYIYIILCFYFSNFLIIFVLKYLNYLTHLWKRSSHVQMSYRTMF